MSPEEPTTDFAKSSPPSPQEMGVFGFQCQAAGCDLPNNNHETPGLPGLALELAGLEQEGINRCLAILDIFEHELPDPNQELFVQGDPMFTYFEELPTEIRHKIWGLLFPSSRRVNLSDPSDYKCVQRYRVGHPLLPITLRINAESRRETLRNYTILMPEDVSYTFRRFVRKPFFFSANRDVFNVELCCGIGLRNQPGFIAHLQQKTNGRLSEIESIYDHHVCTWPTEYAQLKRLVGLPWTAEECMGDGEPPSNISYHHNHILEDDPALEALLLLPGLKNLKFGLKFPGNHYSHPTSPPHEEIIRRFEEVLNMFFEQRKDRFRSKTAPKIVVEEAYIKCQRRTSLGARRRR